MLKAKSLDSKDLPATDDRVSSPGLGVVPLLTSVLSSMGLGSNYGDKLKMNGCVCPLYQTVTHSLL